MNRVCLVGRTTAKPELRYTSSNIPYARFSIAVNRTFSNAQGERETDFINVIVWRRQAENVANYVDKGSLISVEGRLQTGNYTDKDGNKRYTTDVAADSVQFLDTKKQAEARANTAPSTTPYDYEQAPTNTTVDVDDDPFADFGDNVSIDDNFLD